MLIKLGLNNLHLQHGQKALGGSVATLETIQELAAACRNDGATDFVVPSKPLPFTAIVKEMEQKGLLAPVVGNLVPQPVAEDAAPEAAHFHDEVHYYFLCKEIILMMH